MLNNLSGLGRLQLNRRIGAKTQVVRRGLRLVKCVKEVLFSHVVLIPNAICTF